MKLQFLDHFISKDHPTLVLLHGYGSNKEDLFGLQPYFPGYNLLSLEAPTHLGNGGYAWYPITWEAAGKIINPADVSQAALDVISDVKSWVDLKSINGKMVLGGFSQGAILTAAVLKEWPNFADAYLMMSGYFLPEWEELPKINVPVLQTHGTADPVIPFEWAHAGSKRIDHWTAYNFKSYPMGHHLNAECIEDVQDFLKQVVI